MKSVFLLWNVSKRLNSNLNNFPKPPKPLFRKKDNSNKKQSNKKPKPHTITRRSQLQQSITNYLTHREKWNQKPTQNHTTPNANTQSITSQRSAPVDAYLEAPPDGDHRGAVAPLPERPEVRLWADVQGEDWTRGKIRETGGNFARSDPRGNSRDWRKPREIGSARKLNTGVRLKVPSRKKKIKHHSHVNLRTFDLEDFEGVWRRLPSYPTYGVDYMSYAIFHCISYVVDFSKTKKNQTLNWSQRKTRKPKKSRKIH